MARHAKTWFPFHVFWRNRFSKAHAFAQMTNNQKKKYFFLVVEASVKLFFQRLMDHVYSRASSICFANSTPLFIWHVSNLFESFVSNLSSSTLLICLWCFKNGEEMVFFLCRWFWKVVGNGWHAWSFSKMDANFESFEFKVIWNVRH